MNEKPGTIVTCPRDLKWQALGPLDEKGKGIFVSLLYSDLETKGPTHFLMKYSAGVKAPPHIHSGDYYAVVVSGKFRHYLASENEYVILTAERLGFKRATLCTKTVVWVPKIVFSASSGLKVSM